MGTRSLTVFTEDLNNSSEEICVLYRQFDGYPTGHGADLKECLSKAQMGNGIPGGLDLSDGSKFFNGMADLAVQTITRLKKMEVEKASNFAAAKVFGKKMNDLEPGQFYLHKAGTRDCGEDYTYTIYPKGEVVCLKVEGSYKGELYNGPVNDFNPEDVENEDCDCD